MARNEEQPWDPQVLASMLEASEQLASFDPQLSDAMAVALAQLAEREVDAFTRHANGQSFRTIATEMGISTVHAHRLHHNSVAKLGSALAQEPSVMRRLQSPHYETWEAAASHVADEIVNEPYDERVEPLERLTQLRDLMARAWVRGDDVELEDDELFLEVGRIAFEECTTSIREIVATVIDKQRSYGCGNILAFGLTGLAVRMSDKLERLKNLLATGYTPERSEPLEDTWLDLVGYSIVGLLLVRGWFELPLTEIDHG